MIRVHIVNGHGTAVGAQRGDRSIIDQHRFLNERASTRVLAEQIARLVVDQDFGAGVSRRASNRLDSVLLI